MLFILMQLLAVALELHQPAPCSVTVLDVSSDPEKWERWRWRVGWQLHELPPAKKEKSCHFNDRQINHRVHPV